MQSTATKKAYYQIMNDILGTTKECSAKVNSVERLLQEEKFSELTGSYFPGGGDEVHQRYLGFGWKRHLKPSYTVIKLSLLSEIPICTGRLLKGNH